MLDCEEGWVPKNWTVVLEKTLESPLDCKEIQPVHPKGDQSRVFIGRTDAEAETLILWPPHAKSWLIGKDPDAGRDWGQEEKGTTEDDGWMASPTQWTWVWVDSASCWWTGRPGELQFMGSQRVRHDWATELNWTLRYVPSICNILRVFIMKEYILPNAFLASTEVVIWFLFLVLLIWCIIFTKFAHIDHTCFSRINPTVSQSMIFLMCCWMNIGNILLRTFTHTIVRDIGLFYFSMVFISGCSIRAMVASYN